MKPELFDTVTEICYRVEEEIASLNRGGCAVFAVELGTRLKELGVKVVDCKVYNYPEEMPGLTHDNLNEIENELRTNCGDAIADRCAWNYHGVHFVHVKLRADDILWDSEGGVWENEPESKLWNDYYELVEGSMSLEAMAELASVKENWNSTFDRSQIGTLRAIIDECLGTYQDQFMRKAA